MFDKISEGFCLTKYQRYYTHDTYARDAKACPCWPGPVGLLPLPPAA